MGEVGLSSFERKRGYKMEAKFEDRGDCPYYDEVYGCLDCYITKCPYTEDENEDDESEVTKWD